MNLIKANKKSLTILLLLSIVTSQLNALSFSWLTTSYTATKNLFAPKKIATKIKPKMTTKKKVLIAASCTTIATAIFVYYLYRKLVNLAFLASCGNAGSPDMAQRTKSMEIIKICLNNKKIKHHVINTTNTLFFLQIPTIDGHITILKNVTPLHAAYAIGKIELIELLLNNGANISAVDSEGNTPFDLACKFFLINCILTASPDRNQSTSSMDFIRNFLSYDKIKNRIINTTDKSTNIPFQTPDGNTTILKNITPLHIACAIGNTELIKLLVNNGANINAVDSEGNTPLDLAYKAGSSSTKDPISFHLIPEFLEAHGATRTEKESDKNKKDTLLKSENLPDGNAYDILGINENATETEIKTAYKKMALKFHPDQQKDDKKEEAEKTFRNIKKAEKLLLNREARTEYNQKLSKSKKDNNQENNTKKEEKVVEKMTIDEEDDMPGLEEIK